MRVPIISTFPPPMMSGVMNAPTTGTKTSTIAARTPGKVRQHDLQKRAPQVGPQIGSRLHQGEIEFLDLGIHRKDRKGEITIDKPEHDREFVENQAQG